MAETTALITNDIVVLGLIAATLGLIFWASSGPTPLLRRFFAVVPALLLCYFIPAIYNTVGLIDGHATKLYNPVARDVLLPAALVLLTLSIDLPGIIRLGPKLLVVFCAGTAGVMLGAIVSFVVMGWIHPETVAGDTWAGMAALAGSWIGGGANMVAMREVFGVDATTFGQFAVVDVAVASLWMAVLLFLAGRSADIDRASGADTRALDEMRERIAAYQAQHARIPSLTDLMLIVGIAFGAVALAHAVAVPMAAWFDANVSWARQFSLHSPFVWVVVISTSIGLGLSFTRARRLEGAGASKLGSVMLYFLIACIGMQMDLLALLDRPWLFALGVIWMATHILVLWLVARALKAPLFYFAIGSQGNIGAAASAPVVAAAFHPSLAPVGVLLGTVGYASGTYLAYMVGLMLRSLAGQ
ncbi:DUF819 domain-containing protein [Arenimonas caeni]|jgi:uncharacterized membrane protein|uniref:DUF819 family protein n=1 Tax=Arenimonas caeni TaxID=2058085 RepID=UPI002A3644E3|nr:DUF819 family protein [Arenimonas caeni]MDY0022656.1 DUF819 family protein [Arenimonas caeni]